MELIIGISNTYKMKQCPFHHHKQWEILFFTEGNGFFYTQTGAIPFKPGSIFLIPPELSHRSVSEDGYVNITVQGNFENLIFFDELLTVEDNVHNDGRFLIDMINRNRYNDCNYLSVLCTTYIHFLLQEANFKNNIEKKIQQICSQIAENAYDPNIDVGLYLRNSGYAEDYIRMHFKRIVGMPPLKFLTKIRIERACALMEIYKDQVSLVQIAEKCGYTDYIYFSKKFKQQTGMSPQSYINILGVQ